MTCTLVLSSFDLPTHFTSAYLVRYIVPRVEPFQLYGPLARRPFFSLSAPDSSFIIGTGHGDADEYSAQGDSMIWKVGQYNPIEVQGKIINLVSCDTGALLGPDLIKNGAKCFMGFDDDLVFIADSDYWTQPWNCPYSRIGLMPIIDGLQALLDGQTCGDAFAIQQAGFLANIQANDQGNDELGDFDLLQSCLQFDMKHAVLLGNPQSVISRRPRINLPPPPPLLI